ncbi:MAG: LysR family transcriptional regulator [Bacteriovoracaceae bacterium]|nr:LysR family transcriptional regulator [Bacteriovoracaceae bacterium]
MDYRYLKAFILTAQHKSFSKAAEILKIAQSAVSRQIKLLEQAVGEELIIRSSKKVLLTNRGRELYIAAKNFDKVTSNIFQKEDNHPLNIGILHGLLETWLNPIIVKFYEKHERNIHIHIADIPQLRRNMEEGIFDIVFSSENIQSDLVTSLHLFTENMVLISKKEVDIEKIHNYRWIVYGDYDFLYKLSKTPSKSIITVDSITTIVNLVKNNVGIAIVPDHVIKKTDRLKFYDLPGLPKSEIYMTTLSYKVIPGPIKEIVDLIIPTTFGISRK